MKLWFRFFLGGALALLTAAAVHAAPVLTPTGITAAPSSAKPGDSVTLTITAGNSGATTPGDDFALGGSASFSVVFTNISSGYQFTVSGSGTATATIAGAGGSGTFTLSTTLPTQTLEAGAYSARVTMTSGGSGSFTNSSTVLTVTGKPNFVITGLTYSAGTSYVGGNTVPMTVTSSPYHKR